eukprot:TRINITY_DN23125_c0_g1_i1.p1 TRINITY_DN23125_c0_g1~~TRINITY_DN23125_c0_g1_i1.p1  ORF type:complete len:384 (-),score=57.03 TRINITY_DN23125_c0_g1_i1:30-1181(-)
MLAMPRSVVTVAVVHLLVQGPLAIKTRAEVNSTGADHDEWNALKRWLTSSGATVSDKLAEAYTTHSGASVRGVVTNQATRAGEVLVSIPRNLWFAEPDIDFAGVDELGKLSSNDDLPVSIALALEDKKAKRSKWAAYISHLPTLQDFESFYVRFASAELLRRFAPLDFAANVGALQTMDDWDRKRFEHWNDKHRHDIDWNDVRLAMARWRTRNYFLPHTNIRALMPLSDMLNTAPRDELNTFWDDVEDDKFEVKVNSSLSPGSELYESYCPTCVNDDMLQGWGIYFERNPNKVNHSEVSPSFMHFVSKLLEANPTQGMLAPRCKSSTLQMPQGAIMCAFARIAWETYASPAFLQLPGNAAAQAETRVDKEGLLQFNSRGMVYG